MSFLYTFFSVVVFLLWTAWVSALAIAAGSTTLLVVAIMFGIFTCGLSIQDYIFYRRGISV